MPLLGNTSVELLKSFLPISCNNTAKKTGVESKEKSIKPKGLSPHGIILRFFYLLGNNVKSRRLLNRNYYSYGK